MRDKADVARREFLGREGERLAADPTDARQRAWAALKKLVHRADGTAAMPKR
jgi:hypothetical protein